ncbi:cytosolic sulfotransferase 15-like [Senna tora]|uniref:Sulfotransferase n=1 Tax=Senna tora TaxID=362788 RepID=A0A834X138_9FABA|nr:cytosolic sulfotransferase 15-like [Senna tora]
MPPSVGHCDDEEEKLGLEDDFHHEELLQSLPKCKGWVKPHFYFFQNFWSSQNIVKATISFQKNFQAKDTDIFLTSLPKTGTTWLKALIFAIAKRNRFNPSQNDHPLLNYNSHTLVPFFEFDIYGDNPNDFDFSTLLEPRIFGTHIPFPSLSHSIHNSNCKIIYISRNPFDAFISLWHFSNNILSSRSLPTLTLEEAFERYCEGMHPYGPFWSHQLGYWKASKDTPNKALFLKYEELKANTKFELKKMAQFLDCPFSEEEESGGVIDSIIELCSFKKMKELEINKNGKALENVENKHYFRKGETGDWVNYFSPDHCEEEEEKLRLEDLLQSLPKEKGWLGQYMYLYQQFWCRSPLIQPTINFQKHFQAKHSDIVIATLSKSGTTWLKALAFATVKRGRFILTSQQSDSHPLLSSNPHTLVPFFELHSNAMSDLSTLPEPRMFSTHIPFPSLSHSVHNSNCKIVYMCRNPFDTFISYWHFSNNVMSSQSLPTITLEEAFAGYCEGIHSYGPFWSQILGY